MGTIQTTSPAQPKSLIDIMELKENWLSDPCWDIEDTPGFELYYHELKDYRENIERVQNERRAARLAATATKLGCSVELVKYIESLEHRIRELESRP